MSRSTLNVLAAIFFVTFGWSIGVTGWYISTLSGFLDECSYDYDCTLIYVTMAGAIIGTAVALLMTIGVGFCAKKYTPYVSMAGYGNNLLYAAITAIAIDIAAIVMQAYPGLYYELGAQIVSIIACVSLIILAQRMRNHQVSNPEAGLPTTQSYAQHKEMSLNDAQMAYGQQNVQMYAQAQPVATVQQPQFIMPQTQSAVQNAGAWTAGHSIPPQPIILPQQPVVQNHPAATLFTSSNPIFNRMS